MLGVGASKKTYLDDIFSTTLYKSTGSAGTISTGINNATDGGMLWVKSRTDSSNHGIWDTERTNGYYLPVNSNDNGGNITAASGSSPFLRDGGFRWNSNHGWFNNNNSNYAAFNFRKAPGFFDVVTYTGNSTAGRQVSHNLGSIPGLMVVKCTSSAGEPWYVYHKDLGATKHLKLDTDSASSTNTEPWNNTEPTSTHFTLAQYNSSNGSGKTYVAYLFAGGESTAATARSVEFDGTGDVLTLASSSDFNFGTGDFTFEGWLKPNNNTDFQIFLNWGSDNPSIGISNDSNSYIYYNSTVNTKIAGIAAVGQWTHYAISRSSGTTRLFLNGELKNSFSDSHNYGAQALSIGAYSNANFSWNGLISNVRIVKGTAVYTSSFRPPTEPLTNITNTKLLCCNNSSTTGSTVTPGTITANGDPTASSDSPFDDPTGFVFGDSKEGIIKCGSYVANGSSTGPEIHLGWEPQWVMIKKSSASGNGWIMYDVMRGLGADDQYMFANTNASESGFSGAIPTANSLKIITDNASFNTNGETYVYMIIRRPDGYVQKPQLATDVFAMDAGNGSSTIPCFDSGFPVDFALMRRPATTDNWYTGFRLTGPKFMQANSSNAEGTQNDWVFDSNVGWIKGSDQDSAYQSWMWKRHAGFDVVTYDGLTGGKDVPHSLGKTPEMYWIKSKSNGQDWNVYHSGMNGGSSPEGYMMILNGNMAENNAGGSYWNAPTSTHLRLKSANAISATGYQYIAMLFASVSGISKVGSYSGSGSSGNAQNIGFQPRFLFVKRADDSSAWYVFDSIRTTSNPFRYQLELNNSNTQGFVNKVTVSSTGWSFIDTNINESGSTYIYYAHA